LFEFEFWNQILSSLTIGSCGSGSWDYSYFTKNFFPGQW